MNEHVKRAAKAAGRAALKSGIKAFGRAGESVAEDLSAVNEDLGRGIAKLRTGFRNLARDLLGDDDGGH